MFPVSVSLCEWDSNFNCIRCCNFQTKAQRQLTASNSKIRPLPHCVYIYALHIYSAVKIFLWLQQFYHAGHIHLMDVTQMQVVLISVTSCFNSPPMEGRGILRSELGLKEKELLLQYQTSIRVLGKKFLLELTAGG